jgi:CubicO group peptidase (beta-lactamase class C family)
MRDGDQLRPGEPLSEDELDRLEELALDAWREDPLAEAAAIDTLIEGGFAERVMAAEGAPPLQPGLRLAPSQADAPGLEDELPRRRPWGRIAAAVLFAAGFAGVGAYALDPGPPPHTVASVTSAPADPPYAEPDELGRPHFRENGTPGGPVPGDLDASIASMVADYGADWGPAFKFHGSIVVARGDDLVSAQAFGWADADNSVPNTITTRYRLGLLTEQFTAAAVLQLRDQGKLSLEDPISRFVPNYPKGERITVGQLLGHTSGIPNYTALPYFHTWKDKPHTTEQLVGRFSSLPLEFEPGGGFSPSNANYYLLGAVVEQASGSSYAQYVQRHLFNPADMQQSSFGDVYDQPGVASEQAHGRVWNDEEMLDPPDPIHMSVFGGAGGLVSSPVDLVKWNTALYGGKILGPQSLAELTTAGEHRYGYGLAVDHGYGQPVYSFPAAIDGFNGSMIYFAEDDTTVVVLCNTEVVPASRVAQDVAMLVYGDTPERRREAHEVKIAPSTYRRYAGTYRLTEDTWSRYAELTDPERFAMLQTVHVRAFGDRLYFDVPGHGLTWMHPMGRGQFFFKDHSGNRVVFELDASKHAQGMVLRSKNAAFAFTRK